MAAVPLVARERAHDFRDLLAEHKITLVLDYKPNQRFSALPALRKVFLGVDGLERSWAYSYLFAGAWTLFLNGSPRAISAPDTTVLDEHMRRSLAWAIENDVDHAGSIFPADLTKPRANPYDGSDFEKLLFNSFVTAVAWITLHEIAHIVLGHATTPSDDLAKLRADELAADQWAADWLLEKASSEHDRVTRLSRRPEGVRPVHGAFKAIDWNASYAGCSNLQLPFPGLGIRECGAGSRVWIGISSAQIAFIRLSPPIFFYHAREQP